MVQDLLTVSGSSMSSPTYNLSVRWHPKFLVNGNFYSPIARNDQSKDDISAYMMDVQPRIDSETLSRALNDSLESSVGNGTQEAIFMPGAYGMLPYCFDCEGDLI